MFQPLFRIAHLSDLHFATPSWDPRQFFSKRWLGNLNVLFSRKHALDPDSLTTLIPLLHEKRTDLILITGDLSSTSHPHEFALAKHFVQTLQKEGFAVYTLAGNHDQYTKKAFKQGLFYNFFDAFYEENSPFSLKEHGLSTRFLGSDWWLVGLDTAIATSLISSRGLFAKKTQRHLEDFLSSLPSHQSVILMSHYPIFCNDSIRKSLVRKEALKALIHKFPQIKLFLHGHTHRHTVANLQPSGLPLTLDSGSTSLKKNGSWNFIELSDKGCYVQGFKRGIARQEGSWVPFLENRFEWSATT